MDKKFPESGRLSNLCNQIGLFSLKIRKSYAESGRVGSSVTHPLYVTDKMAAAAASAFHIGQDSIPPF